jgi:hypothetical protein
LVKAAVALCVLVIGIVSLLPETERRQPSYVELHRPPVAAVTIAANKR